MKKITVLLAFAFALGLSTSAFAVTQFSHLTGEDGAPDGDYVADSSAMLEAYRTSTNVILIADTTDDQTGYAVGAGHTQGTRIFTSSSGNSQIEVTDLEAGTKPTAENIEAEVTGIDPVDDAAGS